MIKYLLFDLDGTLFDFHKAEKYAFEKTMVQYDTGYEISDLLGIYSVINHNLWKLFEKKEITSDNLRMERFRQLIEKIEINEDPFQMSSEFIKHLGNANFLLDGAIDLLNSLKDNYQMSLITNGLTDVQYNRLRGSEIEPFFSKISISDEVGSPKPHPEIFIDALEKIGNPPKNEILIIGDSASSDILGGYNFGIKTCWYNPQNIDFEYEFEPDMIITKLDELKEKLDEKI